VIVIGMIDPSSIVRCCFLVFIIGLYHFGSYHMDGPRNNILSVLEPKWVTEIL
jgi:hypothetical protein